MMEAARGSSGPHLDVKLVPVTDLRAPAWLTGPGRKSEYRSDYRNRFRRIYMQIKWRFQKIICSVDWVVTCRQVANRMQQIRSMDAILHVNQLRFRWITSGQWDTVCTAVDSKVIKSQSKVAELIVDFCTPVHPAHVTCKCNTYNT